MSYAAAIAVTPALRFAALRRAFVVPIPHRLLPCSHAAKGIYGADDGTVSSAQGGISSGQLGYVKERHRGLPGRTLAGWLALVSGHAVCTC
ncbi:hypothetical protein E2562_036394 [Oryza meyeriana var. granulata]|uniref:Uncharacterized protein n=1 Tax=Oryza meyeriana var. granulata TaxID=110450 RepID=A0A6G1CXD9_9ORYZ|nr:hypothetical protein E2562_036394 [Oryza meyeriana var. granulata]